MESSELFIVIITSFVRINFPEDCFIETGSGIIAMEVEDCLQEMKDEMKRKRKSRGKYKKSFFTD